MKKIFACVLAMCPMVASADYLDDKIAALTKEKLDKIAKLEECQKSAKGLKIAGITTLGVSAIGIGANIGEAVALKNYDAKINTAVQTKSDLDVQIIDAQRKKAEEEAARLAAQSGVNLVYQPVMPGVDVNNTCGIKTCSPDTPTQAMLDILNAKTAVCKDGVWVAQSCKDNFTGIQKSCTLNGQLVLYIEACNSNGGQPEQKTCSDITPAWLAERNAKAGACDVTTGENYITECADDSFNGVPRTTGNKQGYEKCEKIVGPKTSCSDITPAWLAERNAKAGACDTTTGENYITECADNSFNGVPRTTGNKQGYEKCEKSGRKYHENCTAEETAAIPNAATSWWYNGKCVAKSCKPGTYLHVKNGVSQGQCMTACPAWQITDWANGGQACDVAKQKQNCNRKVYGKDEYTSGQCQAKCEEYANESSCNLTGNAVEITSANQCVCNPVQSDVAKSNQVTQENKAACAEKMFTQVNARNCDALCKKYAAENNCDVHKSGSVTTTNMVACYCNPADTVTLDGPNRRAGGFGAAAGVLGGF